MKAHPGGAFQIPLTPMLWSLLLLASCQGCDRPAAQVPAIEEAEAGVRSSKAALPENFEVGPAERGLLKSAGEMDLSNRYGSTVMVAFSDAMEEPQCSGVLVGARLVLTTASCVCAPRTILGMESAPQRLVDSSMCEHEAFVTTVVTGAVRDVRWKEDTTEMEFHTYRGSVRPHPRFRLLLDERGSVVSSQADLAAIVLEEPVGSEVARARLAQAEVQPGEVLVMAGYAHDATQGFGGVYGVRYFRKNLITRAVVNGRGFYRQQGSYLWDGYAGGPCFREDERGLWLVGIASKDASEELSFMSLSFFRDWVGAEQLNATKQDGSSKAADGKERGDEAR